MKDWTESQEPTERPGNWAFQLALCLLGPLFFLSYIFSILSPLPLLYLHAGTPDTRQGRAWAFAALFIGIGLASSVKGALGGVEFFLFAALPAAVLGELLLRRKGPVVSIAGAIGSILLFTAILIFGAKALGVDLIQMAKTSLDTHIHTFVDFLLTHNPPEQNKEELQKLLADPTLLYADLPGVVVSALFLLCALPCLALIRWNPKGFLKRTGIPRDYLRKWKSPDWFVWLALLCGVFHVFEVEYVSAIARNALNPLLLIYFFQGMSILAYFLDSLRLRGPIRVLIYGAGIIFLTPMIVSFGFFDLWFNFRGRHKPPVEDKEP